MLLRARAGGGGSRVGSGRGEYAAAAVVAAGLVVERRRRRSKEGGTVKSRKASQRGGFVRGLLAFFFSLPSLAPFLVPPLDLDKLTGAVVGRQVIFVQLVLVFHFGGHEAPA